MTATPPPGTPPTVSATGTANGSIGGVDSSANQTFNKLDVGKKGYLSQGDVIVKQPYLAGHFQQCDSNHDGRLALAEVEACMQAMPPGAK